MQFVAAYSQDTKSGRVIHTVQTDFEYGEPNEAFSQLNQVNTCWENHINRTGIMKISKKVELASEAYWQWDRKVSLKRSRTMTVGKKLPGGIMAGVDVKHEAGLELGSSSSSKEALSFTKTVNQEFVVEPNQCAKGKVTAVMGTVTAPFVATTTIRGHYDHFGGDFSGGNVAAMCCYSVRGGAEDCGWLGPDEEKWGWGLFITAGDAVRKGQCQNFYDVGDAAKFDTVGRFEGGVGTSAFVQFGECAAGTCNSV